MLTKNTHGQNVGHRLREFVPNWSGHVVTQPSVHLMAIFMVSSSPIVKRHGCLFEFALAVEVPATVAAAVLEGGYVVLDLGERGHRAVLSLPATCRG